MQGQHCNPTIIEIVQEDFIETPWGNTIVDVLDDTERVGEAGLIVNAPSIRGIVGELKLLRMDLIVGVILGGMAMPPRHVRTQSKDLYSARGRGR